MRSQEKREKMWLSRITKAPTPKEKSKKQRDNTKTPQALHNNLIADQLRTVSLNKDIQSTGVVKLVNVTQGSLWQGSRDIQFASLI